MKLLWGAAILQAALYFSEEREGCLSLSAFCDGMILAFVCLHFLPELCWGQWLWLHGAAALGGSILTSLVEKKGFFSGAKGAAATLLILVPLFLWEMALPEFPLSVLAAFLSGCAMYLSCCGILPEEDGLRRKRVSGLWGAVGFFCGCVLFMC